MIEGEYKAVTHVHVGPTIHVCDVCDIILCSNSTGMCCMLLYKPCCIVYAVLNVDL